MSGGYRDEREAALAANQVLLQENEELRKKLEALEAAQREGGAIVPVGDEPRKESSAVTWAIVVIAIVLCTAFVGFFWMISRTPSPYM